MVIYNIIAKKYTAKIQIKNSKRNNKKWLFLRIKQKNKRGIKNRHLNLYKMSKR